MPLDEKLWQELREKLAAENDPENLAGLLAQVQGVSRREQEELKARVSQQLESYKRLSARAAGESQSAYGIR